MAGLKRTLSAGVIDAGFASLSHFAIGIYAIRFFDVNTLGAFELFRTAFLLAAIVPAGLLFDPLLVTSLDHEARQRLGLLSNSLIRGLPLSVVAAAVTLAAVPLVSDDLATSQLVALAVTVFATAILSPLQDFLRRLLHIAHVSAWAAFVSVIHFAATSIFLVTLHTISEVSAWVPFGALALANGLSLSAGLVIVRRAHEVPLRGPKRKHLFELGRWLLFGQASQPAATFAESAVVSTLGGTDVLGFISTARILGQPVLVLATGILASLGPRSMEAAANRIRQQARVVSRQMGLAIAVASVGYLMLVGGAWPWNPLVAIFPTAYEVSGLVGITIAAQGVLGLSYAYRYEMMGARRERTMSVIEAGSNTLRAALSLGVVLLGAYVIPTSLLVVAMCKLGVYAIATSAIYE